MVAPYCPERGDVIWIDFDPQSGREIMKYRPAIVLSPRIYNAQQGLCVVCPISSKRKGNRFEVELVVEKTVSVIKSDQIRSLDWRTRRAKFIQSTPENIADVVAEYVAALVGG
jgi:mRNA interferase MazF